MQEMLGMLVRHEVQDMIALQEGEVNRVEAESHSQILQAIQNTRVVFDDITRSVESELEPEVKIKKDLIETIKKTADWIETIMKCVIDSLGKCRNNRDIFSNLYRNIILQQRLQLGQVNRMPEIGALQQEYTNIKIYFEKKLKETESNLDRIVSRYEVAKQQLNLLGKEKEETLLVIANKETHINDLQKKISNYEVEVKNLSYKLSEVSESLETLRDENSKLKDALLAKTSAMLKIFEKLESERIKRNEETLELTSFRDAKVELEKNLNEEIDEREKMTKILNEKNELIGKLIEKVENLREQTCCEWMQEFKRRYEILELKIKRIFEERERMNSLFNSEKHKEDPTSAKE